MRMNILIKLLFLISLMLLYVNSKAQDTLEIYMTVDNWIKNKIEINEKKQDSVYIVKSKPNSFKRLFSCCCNGYQLIKVVLKKDSGLYTIGDTLQLSLKVRGILSPFKRKYYVNCILEKDKFLLIYINKNLPFYPFFGFHFLTRKRLYCF